MTPEELAENFAFLDDWEERYAYIIDLGRKLAPMDPSDRVDENLVPGCLSQVWLTSRVEDGTAGPTMRFSADSDAHITKGLVAIALMLFDGKSPQAVVDTDLDGFFERLDLGAHVSVNRRNGFYSMIGKIREAGRQHAG
ncbi:MAG: SufE family protein [Deltaproteobacteria bacterium]|nr:SufE family protein [Deltaproteobacteria bacterium]